MSTKRGTLTIAGSGIASVGHITLGTLSYIKESDKIFYLVCDPVTEAFIYDNSTADCFDLSVFYDKTKGRYDSYIQMCEVMLKAVRAGHDVLGVFYGHPGVFVSPSHRAIAVARQEGYKAKMLPGISAEDYMFADLEFDPSVSGCKTCEATEILLRDKPLDPTIQNIIWQVGSVGVVDMEFSKSKFQLLVDRLEKDFGPDHKVVHYIGAVLPQSTTTMDTFTIADLRKEDVAKQFGTISTLYIPPRDEGHVNLSMAKVFGGPGASVKLNDSIKWAGPKLNIVSANDPHERDVIAQVDTHVAPEGHKKLRVSAAMKKFMTDLALKPKFLEEYKLDPVAVVESAEGLSNLERFGLKFARSGPADALMKATESDIASGRQLTEEEIAQGTGPVGLQTALALLVLLGLGVAIVTRPDD
ncbi:tetrapyrrole methylase [Rhizopogon vinicolor AM-OR11-026]|uniref:Tetrapyrrole methylase n=1 Tax=Rhizopogon vinicolor AM-OR11-026 TaxID=1314800 RepID=A0A1B7MJV3_9AGAM|nr:tetrapyrrole methylase [Rhizopogon vinicolor AM-OR11-026]